MFQVNPSPNHPTSSPVETLSPVATGGGGGLQQADFDSDLGVPRCATYGSECSSGDLLEGRGLMKYGNEMNSPNTLNSIACKDGSSGSFHNDESVDRIIVRSGEEDGTGAEVDMAEGGRATIVATVYPWRSGGSDYADFYYAADSSNPQWNFIGTKQPEGSGLQELKMAFDLPQGTNQAVRVNFRYRGVQGINGACSSGSYGERLSCFIMYFYFVVKPLTSFLADDNDDLAFAVKSNPSFTGIDSSEVIFKEEPKDIVADARKRNELRINERGRMKRAKVAKLTDGLERRRK